MYGRWDLFINPIWSYNFKKFNTIIKKNPYPLPFTNEVINIVTGHEVYTFLDGFSGYHQISIAPGD